MFLKKLTIESRAFLTVFFAAVIGLSIEVFMLLQIFEVTVLALFQALSTTVFIYFMPSLITDLIAFSTLLMLSFTALHKVFVKLLMPSHAAFQLSEMRLVNALTVFSIEASAFVKTRDSAAKSSLKNSTVSVTVSLISRQTSLTLFLKSSLFLYRKVKTAMSPAMAPMTSATGPVRAVKAAPRPLLIPLVAPITFEMPPIAEESAPAAVISFPITVTTGPIAAKTKASLRIISC